MNQYLIFGFWILLLDIPFISTLKDKYKKLFFTTFRIKYAMAAYAVMILSFYLIKNSNKKQMLINAAVLGLAIYGTYAFTLMAILPKYNMSLGSTEIIWGIVLFVLSTYMTINFKV